MSTTIYRGYADIGTGNYNRVRMSRSTSPIDIAIAHLAGACVQYLGHEVCYDVRDGLGFWACCGCGTEYPDCDQVEDGGTCEACHDELTTLLGVASGLLSLTRPGNRRDSPAPNPHKP